MTRNSPEPSAPTSTKSPTTTNPPEPSTTAEVQKTDVQKTAAPDVQKTRWRIDPTRSSVEFRTPNMWGLRKVKGGFARYDGTMDLQRTPSIEMTIDANSLNTKNPVRDKHLRSRDFFDVKNHPEVRFVSDSATLEGDRLRVRGQLQAAGRSVPLDLEASVRPVGDELHLDVSTHTHQRELGMTYSMLGMIGSPSELTVHARLVRDSDSQQGDSD